MSSSIVHLYVTKYCISANGNWGMWGSWSGCLSECGDSTQLRTRNCDDPAPVNGGRTCSIAMDGLGERESRACQNAPCPTSKIFFL